MMKRIVLLVLVFGCFMISQMTAQTNDALMKQKEAKVAELAKLEADLAGLTSQADGLKGEIAALTEQLTPYPRWDKGLLGNIGLNLSGFNNWLSKAQPNTSAANIGTTLSGFANADYQKAFWRNSANLTLGWIKFDDKDISTDPTGFQVAADAFNLMSLYGYKLSDKIALSALGEYRTSILDGKFNDPGYLDLGVGATWTPVKDLVVVIHPLDYNFVFSSGDYNYESSLGCKIVADYTRQITKGVAWKSNLSAFLSYKGSELNNWTWVNGFSTAVKGVGIGLDIGLRNNKQESLAAISEGKLDTGKNPLQTYWILGFSYAISSKK